MPKILKHLNQLLPQPEKSETENLIEMLRIQ